MRDDRHHRLAQDGLPHAEDLDAWDVPEPSADLTDRVMNAIAAEQAAIQTGRAQAPADADAQERVHMHATVTDSPSRSLLSPIVIGVATAAAILGSFWLGRQSMGASDADATPPVVQAPALAPAAPPPTVQSVITTGPALPAEVEVTFYVEPSATKITIKDGNDNPMTAADGASLELRRADRPFTVELETPQGVSSVVSLELGTEPEQNFAVDMRASDPTGEAGRSEALKAARSDVPSVDPPKTNQDLKDPFANKTSTLRLGTNPGVPPANLYIDGRFIGKTPRPNVKVTPGRHTVQFKWPGGRTIRKFVVVEEGGSKIVKAG